VVVLDQIDLRALEDEMNLLDIAFLELYFGKGSGHLPEGEETRLLPLRDEELYLIQFVKLSDSQVLAAPSNSARSLPPSSLYSKSSSGTSFFPIQMWADPATTR